MKALTGFFVLLIVAIVFHPPSLSAGQQQSPIILFDLRFSQELAPADAYETVQLIAALQGIVNRNAPRLYVLLTPHDEPWLKYLRQPGQWLAARSFESVPTLSALIDYFRKDIQGVVLYDPDVPATSVIASTAAGVEDLLPVCKRDGEKTIYSQLVSGGPKLPVKRSLVDLFTAEKVGDIKIPSSNSAKCNAYRWAKQTYLDSGRCNPSKMGYYIDYFWTKTGDRSINHTCSNHDYVIAHRGFFWDLNVWEDESPRDDPGQAPGTDLKTLQAILRSAYDQTGGKSMIHISGFTPWAYKYTSHGDAGGRHDPVPTEWQTVKVVSAYNGFLDADALGIGSMANASFYMHFPLAERYVQNPAPTREQLVQRGYLDRDGEVVPKTYIMFYVGDYDSASWLYSQLRSKWDDPARGAVPMGWAINPNLSDRFPVIFPYLYETLSKQDFIITGDSGAGYVNPTQLLEPRQYSGLPSAVEVWQQHNIPYYRQFDLTITGFLINGLSGPISLDSEKMYLPFSWDALVDQGGFAPHGLHLNQNTPVFFHEDLPHQAGRAAEAIARFAKPGQTQFLVRRSILKSAGYHKSIQDRLRGQYSTKEIEVVDPYTFAYLARVYQGGNNDDRVTYIHDTVPRQMIPGKTYEVEFHVRNEGWNRLKVDGPKRVFLRVQFGVNLINAVSYSSSDITPGMTGIFRTRLTAPNKEGHYDLIYGLQQTPDQSFSKRGNLPWKTKINVKKSTHSID